MRKAIKRKIPMTNAPGFYVEYVDGTVGVMGPDAPVQEMAPPGVDVNSLKQDLNDLGGSSDAYKDVIAQQEKAMGMKSEYSDPKKQELLKSLGIELKDGPPVLDDTDANYLEKGDIWKPQTGRQELLNELMIEPDEKEMNRELLRKKMMGGSYGDS